MFSLRFVLSSRLLFSFQWQGFFSLFMISPFQIQHDCQVVGTVTYVDVFCLALVETVWDVKLVYHSFSIFFGC